MAGLMLAFGYWMKENYLAAVLASAFATIFSCWPFVVLITIPIAIDSIRVRGDNHFQEIRSDGVALCYCHCNLFTPMFNYRCIQGDRIRTIVSFNLLVAHDVGRHLLLSKVDYSNAQHPDLQRDGIKAALFTIQL